jgi:hypothetical protein
LEPPDALEKRIRFGCGFLLGLLVATGITLRVLAVNGYYGAAIFVSCGVIFGFLAMKYGDEFWHRLTSWWLSWWWF